MKADETQIQSNQVIDAVDDIERTKLNSPRQLEDDEEMRLAGDGTVNEPETQLEISAVPEEVVLEEVVNEEVVQ